MQFNAIFITHMFIFIPTSVNVSQDQHSHSQTYFCFHLLAKEPRHPVQVLTPLRDSPAGVKEGKWLPQPETLRHVEGMAKKLLMHDEASAVMRHCRRVSES